MASHPAVSAAPATLEAPALQSKAVAVACTHPDLKKMQHVDVANENLQQIVIAL